MINLNAGATLVCNEAWDANRIRNGLAKLSPDIPWAHYFSLGHGIETVTPKDGKYYEKAKGLNKLAELIESVARFNVCGGTLRGKRVLDLACAEGTHSITMARLGAEVLGIEGRQLYVDRARFVADVLGVNQVSFTQGDVRYLNAKELGQFDLVLFSGILHHLGPESFVDTLKSLSAVTCDTLLLYTHVSNEKSIQRFNLQGPTTLPAGYEGYLFREHADGATPQQRLSKVRASLDNTKSFWATEESLVRALKDFGFGHVTKLLHPHLFSWEEASCRLLIVARK